VSRRCNAAAARAGAEGAVKPLTFICLLGAAIGMFLAFAFFGREARHNGIVFLSWITYPSDYWPWPLFGALIAG
jgi:hypothetical protein